MQNTKKPKSLLGMVDTFSGKLRYFVLRAYFGIARRMGMQPSICFFVQLPLRYRGKKFDFHVRHQLDFDILRDTFITEEYLLDTKRKAKVIFDLGSNIGGTVIFFKLWYPEATVYAFEPDKRNLLSLRKNTQQFGESVVVIPKAVVARSQAEVVFYEARKNHWSSSTIERDMDSVIVHVPAITIDEAMTKFRIKSISICKFDIEGGEYEVFACLPSSVNIDMLIGEVHPGIVNSTEKAFIDLLDKFTHLETRPGTVMVFKALKK